MSKPRPRPWTHECLGVGFNVKVTLAATVAVCPDCGKKKP